PDTENGEDGRKASPAPELNDFKETTGEQESMDFGNDPGNKDPRILSGEGRPSMRLIGQAFGTYWFIEFGKRLLVMDQHAAHEKVKFERIRSQIMSGEVFTQMINPPFTVNLTPGQSEILETYQEDLEKLGFETDSLGGGTYALRSVPIELFGCDPGDLLSEILDDLKNKGSATRESSSVRLRIATMACKAAVKGNTVLPFEKAEALLNELVTLEEPYHCPHGRPTIIEIKESELDKRFKRIQD
nr:DNA mismatch repair protein MutL [Lachnospiraceae bacterium]